MSYSGEMALLLSHATAVSQVYSRAFGNDYTGQEFINLIVNANVDSKFTIQRTGGVFYVSCDKADGACPELINEEENYVFNQMAYVYGSLLRLSHTSRYLQDDFKRWTHWMEDVLIKLNLNYSVLVSTIPNGFITRVDTNGVYFDLENISFDLSMCKHSYLI